MRIIIASISYEGIIRNKKELLMKLKKLGHEIFIIAPYSSESKEAMSLGFTYYPIAIEAHGKDMISDLKVYKQYLSLYKTIKPNLVLNLTIKPNVYSGMACRRLNIKYIGTINGVGSAIYNGGLLGSITLWLLKKGLKSAECVFFQNKKNRDLFIKKGITTEDRSSLVPGSGINIGLHPYEEYPSDDGPITLTFIGRISKDKGINELIEVARILYSRKENLIINIVGSCPDSYKDLIMGANSKGIIHYLGRVEPREIHGIIKESHAVILPSYHEGIANVLLEGGAAGRPIIASFAEGCEETFDHGVSGIGFEPKNTEALLSAIEVFLKMTNEERKKMGIEASKKITKEFNRDIVDDAYIKEIVKLEVR